jgi:hypothetical protein
LKPPTRKKKSAGRKSFAAKKIQQSAAVPATFRNTEKLVLQVFSLTHTCYVVSHGYHRATHHDAAEAMHRSPWKSMSGVLVASRCEDMDMLRVLDA